MKMFKKTNAPEKKRDVMRRFDYSPYHHQLVLDEGLRAEIKAAGIYNDAQEVIECLKESPRFKRHLCAEAEKFLEAKLKEVEEARKAVKAACYFGAA